jgi:hypothetical protein
VSIAGYEVTVDFVPTAASEVINNCMSAVHCMTEQLVLCHQLVSNRRLVFCQLSPNLTGSTEGGLLL